LAQSLPLSILRTQGVKAKKVPDKLSGTRSWRYYQ